MKIVLVNLPWKKGNRWGVRAGSRWPHVKDNTEENYLSFPFYLAYAVALLNKNGFGAHIIDAIAEKTSYESFYKKIVSLNPDLLVVETSTVTLNHDMRFLSRFNGNFPVALCGPDVHIAKVDFLNENKNIDYILFGEYEASLLELARKLKNNEPLDSVKGILYRQGDKVVKNPFCGDICESKSPITSFVNIAFSSFFIHCIDIPLRCNCNHHPFAAFFFAI